MKTIVIYILCMILSGITFGQVTEEKMEHVDVNEVKVVPPKFTGVKNVVLLQSEGESISIEDYLAKNIEYPEKDRKSFNQGTEVVQFMVTPNGELTDFTIVNSVSPQIDKEVIRVLKTTNGMWLPGDNNGKPVAMENEVSVAFKINGIRYPLDFKEQAMKYFVRGGDMLLTNHKPKKALKFYDKAILFLPSDESLLLMRGLAKYETGDIDGAIRDWQRIASLGHNFNSKNLNQITDLKGYEEFIKTIYK